MKAATKPDRKENTMKDFTTPEYIAPIMDEIRTLYKPITDRATCTCLDCIVLLQKRTSRDALAVREPSKGAFYYSGPAARDLFRKLDEWTQAAETEPAELDRWKWYEQKNIMEAIRTALIDEYRRPGA